MLAPSQAQEVPGALGGAMVMGQKSNTRKNKNLREIVGIF
jgi:hypothetical protein